MQGRHCHKLNANTYERMFELATVQVIEIVGVFVEYWAESELAVMWNVMFTKSMRLLSNRENYLPINSAWFAKCLSRARRELHDCFVRREEK